MYTKLIIFVLHNQRKAKKILRKGIEFRKAQLNVAQRASDLESDGKKRNAEEFVTRVEEVTARHEEALRSLDDTARARRSELGGSDATKLTDALADKFDLQNKDEQ